MTAIQYLESKWLWGKLQAAIDSTSVFNGVCGLELLILAVLSGRGKTSGRALAQRNKLRSFLYSQFILVLEKIRNGLHNLASAC